ncbi:hypothetical protein NESM_000168300 [Novymonas esmeraldas]|uniref:Uncharacterized protein n=1 Tax=Novymonas esmeraldas TaxID=1808958 RepID=A0AAW0F5R1_9TRYP
MGVADRQLTPRLRRLLARASSSSHPPHRSALSPPHGARDDDDVQSWFRAASSTSRAVALLRRFRCDVVPQAWAPLCFADPVRPATAACARWTGADASTPPPPPSSSPLLFLLNSVFLHETSLFLLLLRHPLPFSSLAPLCPASLREPAMLGSTDTSVNAASPRGFYVLERNRWRVCAPDSVEATWLAAATPAINVQLECGASGDGGSGGVRDAVLSRLPSHDFLEHLIWPTHAAGAVRPDLVADDVWVDSASVRDHSLRYFGDAWWAPCASALTFTQWHRAVLEHAATTRDGDNDGGHDGGTDESVDGAFARRWMGDLYLRHIF